MTFTPLNPEYEADLRRMFQSQGLMGHLGARLTRIEPGLVEIEAAFRSGLSQQNGFFHAGVSSALADTAGGFAAFTLFPPGRDVLTVEFKINLMAPAKGDRLRARGAVVRSGRSLTVCELDVFVTDGGREVACAKGLQTLMRMEPRPA
ncbi:MAG TPA: PaaI family thioesterase [Azospirillaceae bacterium]|nr:PaaI family thioesterase [Azospirillaceae bacterium]